VFASLAPNQFAYSNQQSYGCLKQQLHEVQMAERSQYEELARQISAIGAVKRGMARGLPTDCPPASAAVLTILDKHGELRTSQLAELMAIDMSVTSRHVAHVADRGWIERRPDPQDGRSRLLRISESGERFLMELTAHAVEVLATHLDDWNDEDVAQLSTLLARLRSSFGDCRTRGGPLHEPATTPTATTPSTPSTAKNDNDRTTLSTST
jgi:DNA-binding MarR family transcriptional regulator